MIFDVFFECLQTQIRNQSDLMQPIMQNGLNSGGYFMKFLIFSFGLTSPQAYIFIIKSYSDRVQSNNQ